MNLCSTVACFSRFLQQEHLMELLDSVILFLLWPSAFATVPMMYAAPLSGMFTQSSAAATSRSSTKFVL